ncbi:MAG: long-chain fatty acid--CoA ligase [Nitrospirota bacterium]
MAGSLSLTERVLRFIADPAADRFDALALEVFAHQYAQNLPYRQFCDRRGVTPERVREWRRIPAVPASAFKVADLTCRPKQPSTYFLTSGTTQGTDRRGRHIVANVALYHAAILPNAQAHLFPDLGPDGRITILSLTPPPPHRPHSSLIHMIDRLISRWGAPGSGYVGTAAGLDADALAAALRRAEEDGKPIALLGTTAAVALFFAYCDERGLTFALPASSRIMDTGGAKGLGGDTTRYADRPAFLEACRRILNLYPRAVINEYGMTELCSQFYAAGSASGFSIPHWVRVQAIDPRTDDDAPAGEPGLLRHYDLANLESVMAIQTDDLGLRRTAGGRFHLLGRASGAEARGCSLDPAALSLSTP